MLACECRKYLNPTKQVPDGIAKYHGELSKYYRCYKCGSIFLKNFHGKLCNCDISSVERHLRVEPQATLYWSTTLQADQRH